jgi:hypothetical protein
MKYLFVLLTIVVVQKSPAQSNADFKEIVKKAHYAFINGILSEDYQLVSEILADEVTLGTPGGGFVTKQGYVSALKSGTLLYDSSANHSFNVRIYGMIGVVTGNVDLAFRYKDESNGWFRMLEHLTFTAVYAMNKKSARMVAWQSNRPTTDTIEKVKDKE